MSNWNPASLLINRKVVNGLKRSEQVWDHRKTGKTETLLAYIALNHEDAIIVGETVPIISNIKSRWEERYPMLVPPRFLSRRQFVTADGLRGTVFTDECLGYYDSVFHSRFNPWLKYGGGVKS